MTSIVRVTLELVPKQSSQQTLVLPYHYVEWVQAAIYRSMQEDVAAAIHDVGFPVEKRSFRLFSFSRIQGRFRQAKETIEFVFPVRLIIASPLKLLIQQFVNALVMRNEFILGPQVCRIASVSVDDYVVPGSRVRVRTLSPLTVHSTLNKPDGSHYTVYFHPKEHEFQQLIIENLLRKYTVVTGKPFVMEPAESLPFRIRVKNEPKLNIVRYKDTVIKGYSGVFDIEGPKDLLQVGWDAGFGARNSQGFGLVEMAGSYSEGV